MTADTVPEPAEERTVFEDAFWDPHASPRSVWAAILAYPFVLLAVYLRSRRLLAGIVLWFVANLHAASPPETDDAWATRIVRGEQVWLERGLSTERGALGLVAVGAAVHLFAVRAAANRRPVRTVAGTVASMGLMFVFFDRMVDLYGRSEALRPENE